MSSKLIPYKGFNIEVKIDHWTGIHENWIARVHGSQGVLASFGKAVPAISNWESRQQDAINQAKQWIDSQQ